MERIKVLELSSRECVGRYERAGSSQEEKKKGVKQSLDEIKSRTKHMKPVVSFG